MHSLDEGIQKAGEEEKIFVIGGGQLYNAALPIADEIYVTEISDENGNLNLFEPFPGDTYFPQLNEQEWDLVRPGKRKFVAANRMVPIPIAQLKRRGLYFRFQKYMRRRSTKEAR